MSSGQPCRKTHRSKLEDTIMINYAFLVFTLFVSSIASQQAIAQDYDAYDSRQYSSVTRDLQRLLHRCDRMNSSRDEARCLRTGILHIVNSNDRFDEYYQCAHVNVYRKYAEGGGCNVHGCYYPGGDCSVFGCFYEGGSCNVHGCVRKAPKTTKACVD